LVQAQAAPLQPEAGQLQQVQQRQPVQLQHAKAQITRKFTHIRMMR